MKAVSRRTALTVAALGALTGTAPGAGAKESAQKDAVARTYDVVVVGLGFAGMCAALEAKERGANVVILEKMEYPAGNTIYAGGWISALGSRLQKNHPEDTKEAYFNDMMRISGGRSDPDLLHVYVEESGNGIDWLQEHGVPLELVENLPPPELSRSIAVVGNTRGGAVLARAMLAALEKAGVPILYNTKAVKLVVDDVLHVHGVVAISPRGREEYLANGGVVLATGGYGSNEAMVTQFMGSWASRLVPRGSHYCTGENILMTNEVMAKLVHVDQFYAGPITPRGSCNPSSIMHTGYGIQVNSDGERFLTESLLQVPKSKAIAEKTKDNLSFLVLDQQANDANGILDKTVARFAKLDMKPYVGETLADVAKAAGVPPERLEKTVADYNAAVKAGKLDALDPPYGYEKAYPIEKGPFVMIPVSGGICSTMGGPLIDTKARVLNFEERPILGLYAAGAAAGGLWYGEDLGGNQFGGCLVFGRIAGREATARAKVRA